MNKTKINAMIDYYLCKLSIKESINDQIDIIKSHDYVDKDKIKYINLLAGLLPLPQLRTNI